MKKKINFTTWFQEMMGKSNFLMRYSLFRKILPFIFPQESDAVAVMAVGPDDKDSGKYHLLINKRAIENNDEYRSCFCGLLLHEILHVMLGHCDSRYRRLDVVARNLAADLTVNELIKDPLPKEGIFLQEYQTIIPGLERYQSTMERYEIISKWYNHNARLLPPAISEKLDEITRVDDIISSLEKSGKSLLNILKDLLNKINLPDEENNIIADELRKKRSINTETQVEEYKIDDRSSLHHNYCYELKHYLTSSIKKSYLAPTLKRPNRRFPDMVGIIPGKKYLTRNHSLLVGIDTSGSMTESEFAMIEQELQWMQKTTKDITIVECDSAIRRTYEFEGTLSSVYGRGDTNLKDIFLYKDKKKKHDPIIVIFTDGFIEKLENKKIKYETIWVLTKCNGLQALDAACSFGKRIILADALDEEKYLFWRNV